MVKPVFYPLNCEVLSVRSKCSKITISCKYLLFTQNQQVEKYNLEHIHLYRPGEHTFIPSWRTYIHTNLETIHLYQPGDHTLKLTWRTYIYTNLETIHWNQPGEHTFIPSWRPYIYTVLENIHFYRPGEHTFIPTWRTYIYTLLVNIHSNQPGEHTFIPSWRTYIHTNLETKHKTNLENIYLNQPGEHTFKLTLRKYIQTRHQIDREKRKYLQEFAKTFINFRFSLLPKGTVNATFRDSCELCNKVHFAFSAIFKILAKVQKYCWEMKGFWSFIVKNYDHDTLEYNYDRLR